MRSFETECFELGSFQKKDREIAKLTLNLLSFLLNGI